MEDWLERNASLLYEKKGSNDEQQEHLLYVCIPLGRDIENYIITKDFKMTDYLVKEKKYTIQVFKKDTAGVYKCYNK